MRHSKISRIFNFLNDLVVDGVSSMLIVDDEQGTNALASCTGRQIVAAYPELSRRGDSDAFVEEVSFAVFVLERAMTANRTTEREKAQFQQLLTSAESILTLLAEATTSDTSPLCGMTLGEAQVIPVYAKFGGWNGWSVVISV